MEALLLAIEGLAPVRALRTSFYVYPVINALHVLAVGSLVSTVALMDLRILGVIASVPEALFVRLLRRVALGAFALAVLTGLLLFAVRARDYAGMPLFWGKMGLIGLAALNFALFSVLRGAAAKALAALSIVLWLGVLLAGRFLGFVGSG